MDTYIFLIIIDNKKYYSKCVFNIETMSLINVKDEPKNLQEHYCSLWMKEILNEPVIVKYIGKLSYVNTEHKFDLIIDESKSNYVYIKKKLKVDNFKINFDTDIIIKKDTFNLE